MTLTNGVEETYYKSFILTEDGLKEFQRIMENAVQRFPAPAELTYTIVTSDFRYFETKRIEDATHDLEVQKQNIVQVALEAKFIEQPLSIEENIIKTTPDNWNIRVMFSIPQKEFWDTRADKISLRVKSEDRKWANDYIDRFEDLVYKTPKGNRTPTMIFFLFAAPLFIFAKTYFEQINHPAAWYLSVGGRVMFYAYAAASALMALIGVAVDAFGYSPYAFRVLFGPESSFVWGQGKVNHEAREYARQITMWVVGIVFIIFLLVSVNYAVR
ncbi:MAG: hypothetical protein PHQ36_02165 [Anaerolineales bacterium]|nr:hypothetical protein [Anaerolineales bacterium]